MFFNPTYVQAYFIQVIKYNIYIYILANPILHNDTSNSHSIQKRDTLKSCIDSSLK